MKLSINVCGERYISNLFDAFTFGFSPYGFVRDFTADFFELSSPITSLFGLINI